MIPSSNREWSNTEAARVTCRGPRAAPAWAPSSSFTKTSAWWTTSRTWHGTFAKEGFAALAPDMLQRTGGTAQYQTSEDAIAAIRSLDPNGCVEDLTSALEYLKSQGFANGKVGVVGYCWGGGQSLNFATKCNGLNAAVVYYGRNPNPLEQVANISCPLMGNYAEDDPNIMPGIEPLKAELAKSGKSIDLKIYGDGAKHAFNNNTNADRWHPEAAKDAWQRTVDFYKANLSG